MHPALWKLYRLRVRGIFRSISRKLKSVRGAALTVFTVLLFGLMFGQNLMIVLLHGPSRVMGRGTDTFHEVLPILMFLYCILSVGTSLGERAVYFSPSEVDFLFTAPFSRRQLLLYRIVGNLSAAALFALILATSMIMLVRSWPAAAAGFFLAWLFLNSLNLCVQLVAEIVSERAFTRARRLLLWGAVALGALALGQAASRGLNGSWQETVRQIRHWPVADSLLAPFELYARIITAQRLIPDAMVWAVPGLVLVIALYGLAVRLDANYLETAVRVSQQMQQRRRRAASEGIFARHSKRPVRTSRVPQFPWFGGVGPLAWRQALQVLRGSRRGLLLAGIVLVAVAAPMLMNLRRSPHLPLVLPHVVIGAIAYVTVLISAQISLGFRGDYLRMDLLKSLPIRPLALACGQLLMVVLVLTLVQWSLFAATAILLPASATEMLIAGLFAFPFNWMLFGIEDLLFLFYPSPIVATGSDSFLKMGRVMLSMLVKFFVLALCAAIAVVPAAVAFVLTGSVVIACMIGWCLLLIPALGMLMLLAWAFRRYDVTCVVSE